MGGHVTTEHVQINVCDDIEFLTYPTVSLIPLHTLIVVTVYDYHTVIAHTACVSVECKCPGRVGL